MKYRFLKSFSFSALSLIFFTSLPAYADSVQNSDKQENLINSETNQYYYKSLKGNIKKYWKTLEERIKVTPSYRLSNNTIYDDYGIAAGSINDDGIILNNDNKYAGFIDDTGHFIDTKGHYLGEITDEGRMTDNHGHYLGQYENNGAITNKHGRYIGQIEPDGTILDKDGYYVAQYPPTAPGMRLGIYDYTIKHQ